MFSYISLQLQIFIYLYLYFQTNLQWKSGASTTCTDCLTARQQPHIFKSKSQLYHCMLNASKTYLLIIILLNTVAVTTFKKSFHTPLAPSETSILESTYYPQGNLHCLCISCSMKWSKDHDRLKFVANEAICTQIGNSY